MRRLLLAAVLGFLAATAAEAQSIPGSGLSISGGSSSPTGAAGGDLGGTYPNPTVASIGGKAVSLGGPLTTTGAGGVTINGGAAGVALTIASGKTFTASNTLTFAGTDGSTLNVGAGGTLGSNAFTSTAYLPLTGGTLTGTLIVPSGSASAVGAGFAANNGLYSRGGGDIDFAIAGNTPFEVGTGTNTTTTAYGIGASLVVPDIFLNRQAAGVFGVGTSTSNVSGGIQAATLALGGAAIGGNALAVAGAGAFSSAVTITGGAPAQAAGTLGLFGGNGSTPTLGANGEGDVFTNTASGLILIGQGSSQDFELLNKAGSLVMFVPTGTTTAAFNGQIQAQAMTQTSAAQSGTVCQNTGATLTYDATLGCLSSAETLKVDLSYGLPDAVPELMALRPMTYRWADDAPRFRDDPGEHIGMGAFATAYVDERLIARGADDQPRGWRTDAMVALAVAGFQDHEARLKRLEAAR